MQAAQPCLEKREGLLRVIDPSIEQELRDQGREARAPAQVEIPAGS